MRGLCLSLCCLAGCYQDLELLVEDAGITEPDSGADAGRGFDAGSDDLGTRDLGTSDLGGPDLGPSPLRCSDRGEVDEATLCLDEVEGEAGSAVALPVFALLPSSCEGTGVQSGTLEIDDERFTLLNETALGCFSRAQDGDLVIWTARTSAQDIECPTFLAGMLRDQLIFQIEPSTPPGRYPIRWLSTFVQGADVSVPCPGSGSIDAAIRVR
ncbi:MAG: hypothetical protein AAGD10_04220 [Myxococcota bacterium]